MLEFLSDSDVKMSCLTFISYENKSKHKQLYSDQWIDEGGSSLVASMRISYYHILDDTDYDRSLDDSLHFVFVSDADN